LRCKPVHFDENIKEIALHVIESGGLCGGGVHIQVNTMNSTLQVDGLTSKISGRWGAAALAELLNICSQGNDLIVVDAPRLGTVCINRSRM
jgi:hypothetical protein